MAYLSGADRSQAILFPPSLDEYVEEHNVVRVIDAFISRLALRALGFSRTVPAATGRPGYDPRDLLRLYVYGYMNRVRSSRRLEQEAARNVEVMWLLRGLRPDYKTIADFRRDHPEALKQVYRAFLEFCRKAALLNGRQVAVDGSKFQAANGREKNQTQSGLKQALKAVEERIARYLKDLEEGDREEDEGEDLAQKLAALAQKKSEFETLLRELEEAGQTQRSQTDPESRRMQVRGGGTGVCYNVQVAVDTQHHLIVEYEVTNEGNDLHQLSAMAVSAKQALEAESLEVLADRGYYNGTEIAACVEAGITPAVPRTKSSQNEKKGLYTNERFAYDAAQDLYVCPAGQRLALARTETHGGRAMGIYTNAAACRDCPLAARCHQNQNGRYIRRPPEAALLEQMRVRLKENPDLMRVRQKVVEHPFGTIKRAMEQGYFLLRGRPKVRGEFALTALAYNLKRVLTVLGARGLLDALRRWQPSGAAPEAGPA